MPRVWTPCVGGTVVVRRMVERATEPDALGEFAASEATGLWMRDFICPNCGQRLAFENSVCLSCDSHLGFSLEQMSFLVIAEGGSTQPGIVLASDYQLCANRILAECNWLVPVEPVHRLCQIGRAHV